MKPTSPKNSKFQQNPGRLKGGKEDYQSKKWWGGQHPNQFQSSSQQQNYSKPTKTRQDAQTLVYEQPTILPNIPDPILVLVASNTERHGFVGEILPEIDGNPAG